MKYGFRYLPLLILPALLVGMFYYQKSHIGPYYQHTGDPAYMYLCNGLNIAHATAPENIDNPGTPLQVLVGAVLRAGHIVSGEGTLNEDVLTHPEGYLYAANQLIILFAAAALLFLGGAVYTATGGIFWALAAQTAPFLTIKSLAVLHRVSPEPLLLSISLLLAGVCILTLRYDPRRFGLRYALSFGVLCGLGIATKLTFVPMLLVPLIVLRTWMDRVLSLLSLLVGFVLFTVPIISEYPRIIAWVHNLLVFPGRYGEKAVGRAMSWPKALKEIFVFELPFGPGFILYALFIAVIAGIVVWTGIRLMRRRELPGGPVPRLMLAGIISFAVHVMMTALHHGKFYELPQVGFAGIWLVLLGLLLVHAIGRKSFGLVIPMAIFIAAVGWSGNLYLDMFNALQSYPVKKDCSTARQLNEAGLGQCLTVGAYGSCSQRFALDYGNIQAGGRYSEDLRRLYPEYRRYVYFDEWKKERSCSVLFAEQSRDFDFWKSIEEGGVTTTTTRARFDCRLVFTYPDCVVYSGAPLARVDKTSSDYQVLFGRQGITTVYEGAHQALYFLKQ